MTPIQLGRNMNGEEMNEWYERETKYFNNDGNQENIIKRKCMFNSRIRPLMHQSVPALPFMSHPLKKYVDII